MFNDYYFYFKDAMSFKRKMRDEWLEKEEFKEWLAKVDDDPTKAHAPSARKLLQPI